MSRTVVIKVGNRMKVQWPQRCIQCGQPSTGTVTLPVGRVDRRMRRAAGREAALEIPYCDLHLRRYQLYNRILGISLISGLVLGALVSILVNLVSGRTKIAFLTYLIGSLFSAILGGAVFGVLAHLVMSAVGQDWRSISLTKTGAMGLSVSYGSREDELYLMLKNDEIGDEISRMNA